MLLRFIESIPDNFGKKLFPWMMLHPIRFYKSNSGIIRPDNEIIGGRGPGGPGARALPLGLSQHYVVQGFIR